MATEDTVVGTPEGDNEFKPDEPLQPLPDDALQVPDGSSPAPYRQDRSTSDGK
jgi:hypothetical protein